MEACGGDMASTWMLKLVSRMPSLMLTRKKGVNNSNWQHQLRNGRLNIGSPILMAAPAGC